MENIWAPWRKEFILSKKEENCFFCTAIKDNQDRKNLVLYRGKECFCILNKYPYNSGHLMVAPKMHKDDLSKLSDSEMLELLTLTRDVKDILTKKLKPEGFNLGINFGKVAGAGVEGHIHLHLVPRWKGDTNFMPVIAETKVIPQSLEDLYLELKDYF
ncbi:MAG TPA: HIT domain-containing protein [Candidatus Scalindua sp.]|jgi:ATP adenylyltransferase|nr:HIT domain-containing protein [Candidatus Scalindua sp.]